MAFNFETNPVAINNITKTLENLKNSIKLQDKIVEIDSNGQEIVTADSDYDGLGKVTINTDVPTKPEEVLTETITENGLKTFNPTAGSVFSSASITVNVPEKKIEAEKTVNITENKETVITPTEGNDGMAKVTVNVNVPTGGSGFDFSVIGYDGELQQQLNDGIQADINYSKEKYLE